ncbi:hypothetical protein TanjilG_13630 [Lupinus angustifolius]|uniref:Large ribosomal subunit protein bL9c n=1 Tax=Lupinus angustifolius TaxID=3871 RepID=A0A1J7HKV3_LUPAN|nr:PREDICTED: uncharacterized protein LOC109358883 [Lupinus angustifolius]OIW02993.1 hypothetical protein TanjilG_13630 [Lupinus angustifolius]
MGCFLRYGRQGVRQIFKFRNDTYDSSVVNPLLYASQGLRYNRKLQVILTTDIDKLGKAGYTVKVAPGFFRNHLMPKLLAVPNIDKFAHLITEQHKVYQPIEKEEAKEDVKVVKESKEDMMKEYEKAALRLDKAKLVLRRLIDVQKAKSRATKDDPLELRFPITKEVIVAEVARQLCVNIAPENLHLPSPLSTLGEYEVPLRLPRSISLPEGKVNWSMKVKIRSK